MVVYIPLRRLSLSGGLIRKQASICSNYDILFPRISLFIMCNLSFRLIMQTMQKVKIENLWEFTLYVLSPKKWTSGNSSRYLKQKVLSQPCGKTCYRNQVEMRINNQFYSKGKIQCLRLTSKLICPPIENVRLKCANFSRRTETIFGRMLWT